MIQFIVILGLVVIAVRVFAPTDFFKHKFDSRNPVFSPREFSNSEHEHNLFKSLDEALRGKLDDADFSTHSLEPNHPVFKEVHQSVTNKSYEEYLPYVKRYCLMTDAERNFFKVLQEVVQHKYYIVPQVQLSKLVDIEKGRKWEYSPRNRVDRKSVDFTLFYKESFAPYLVIELDDKSHLRWDRRERDDFIDRLLNKVGIRIVHIKTAYNYDLAEISAIIN